MTLRHRFLAIGCALLAGLTMSQLAAASVSIGGTRVIFSEAKRETTIQIKNGDAAPYLLQSWVDDSAGKKGTFLVTPPLVRIDGNKEMILRIVRTGGDLPNDRESVFYFNVKEIPQQAAEENVLQIAVRSRMKLFYRPAGLPGTAAEAPASLQWHVVQGDGGAPALEVTNPSAYHVTIVDAKAGAQTLRNDMVAPKSTLKWPLTAGKTGQSIDVTFSTMNDYGAETAPVNVTATPQASR
ncbi:fimbrial biogenesis chaperone [Paraburkholderia fungorum]|uniref:fimbrial biogenesis chaperone n=1 Tax=Paraburkholderia fungorum TaxID=134537 RepID=UPI0038BA62BF